MRYETLDVDYCIALLRKKKFKYIRELGVRREMLHDEGRVMFDSITKYAKQNGGRLPSLAWVVRETDVDVMTDHKVDRIQAIARSLHERFVGVLVSKELSKVGKSLKEKDTLQAASRLRAAAERVRRVELGGIAAITNLASMDSVEARAARYVRMKKFDGQPDGIRSWMPTLDSHTLGWHPKELIVLAAKEKTGKTFALIRLALEAWKQKKRVLFVELEMPVEQIEQRADAVDAGLDFGALRRGKLGTAGEEVYRKYLKRIQKRKHPFYVVDNTQVRSLDEIAGLALDIKADIVFIDGIYILGRLSGAQKEDGKDGGGRDQALWEKVLNSAADAKEFAKATNLPWIVTTQLSPSLKADAMTATTADLGYAKGIGQWADMVFALMMPTNLSDYDVRIWRTVVARNFEPIDLLLHWDLVSQNFAEVCVWTGDLAKKINGLLVSKTKKVGPGAGTAPASPPPSAKTPPKVVSRQLSIPFGP